MITQCSVRMQFISLCVCVGERENLDDLNKLVYSTLTRKQRLRKQRKINITMRSALAEGLFTGRSRDL